MPGKLPSVRLENKLIHGAMGRGLGKDLPAWWGIITLGLNTSLVLPANLISKTQKVQIVSKRLVLRELSSRRCVGLYQ